MALLDRGVVVLSAPVLAQPVAGPTDPLRPQPLGGATVAQDGARHDLEAVGESWMAEERFSLLEDEDGVFVIRTAWW